MWANSFFWQVRAVNASGTTYADGGVWWEFTTLSTTSFSSVGTCDGWVRERSEESGKGGAVRSPLATGSLGDDAADRQYRSILHFETSTLPDDAISTSLTLRIRRSGVTGTNPIGTHGLRKVDMQAGCDHDNPVLERFDFHAIGSRGNVGRVIKTPGDRWCRAPLSARASEHNLTGTTRFRLRFGLDHDDDMNADPLRVFTGDAASADRPELIITCYVPWNP